MSLFSCISSNCPWREGPAETTVSRSRRRSRALPTRGLGSDRDVERGGAGDRAKSQRGGAAIGDGVGNGV